MSTSSAPSMISATERIALAEEFLRGAKWKLIYARGSGKSVNGTKVRIRMYAVGCPANSLREVQDLLAAEKPIKDPMIDGMAMSGTYYHRTSWWTGKIGAPMSVVPGTVTIVRELTDDVNLQNTNTVEDDCGNTTTIRFVWDAESIEDVTAIPESGDQGFQVKIGGVNRDPETGYYSYYVTITERKFQYVPEHVVGEDAFSTDYAEAWLGLRGTIAAPLDDEGAPVTVLNPDVFEVGKAKSVTWRKNTEDCTYDAEGRLKIAKRNVITGEACEVDIYKEVDRIETSAQVAKLGHAPAATGGIKKSHKSDLRQDGLWNNTVGTDTEKKVADSTKVLASTIFETEVSAVQTNIPEAEVPALPAAGNGATSTLQVEKTQGDLRIARLATKTELNVADASVTRETDLLKDETSTEDVAAAPLGNPPAAGLGLVTSHRDTKTPGGKYRRLKIVKRAKSAASWVVNAASTWLTRMTSSTDVNQLVPANTSPIAEVGKKKEVVKRSNPDGTFENVLQTTESIERLNGPLLLSKDQFKETVVEQTRNKRGAVQADAAGGSGGLVSQASDSLQEDGTHEAVKQSTVEKPVSLSRYDTSNTLHGKRITERNEHQTNEATLAADKYGSVGYEKTPGGLKNTMKTYWDLSVLPADGRILSRKKWGTVTFNAEMIQRVFPTDPGYGKTGLVVADNNTIYTSEIDAHESGAFIRTDTANTPIQNITEWVEHTYIYTEENYNNTGEDATINLYVFIRDFTNVQWPTVAGYISGFVNPSTYDLQWNLNDYWLYNGSISVRNMSVTLGT